MAQEPPTTPTGPWQGRVLFAPDGGFAFRPDGFLVRRELTETAVEQLQRSARFAPEFDVQREERVGGAFEMVTLDVPARQRGDVDVVLRALEVLDEAGIPAQPNHVMFATGGCCPPHPASPGAEAFYADPSVERALTANPFRARAYGADPFEAACGGCWGCCGGGLAGNPFRARGLTAYPFRARATTNPALDACAQATGRRRSSARPDDGPDLGDRGSAGDTRVRVAILDTGWAESHVPGALTAQMHLVEDGGDRPDEDGDGFLDPAAGHGTFIAGIIEQGAPGCVLEVTNVLTSYGDGDEAAVGDALVELASRADDERPDLVNLSFGGYTPVGMSVLAHAIDELRRTGTIVVASAGNDATCAPLYPGAFPGVINVGALDPKGDPAPFTNYGPWVNACTGGVDVVSLFFDGFDGAEPPDPSGVDDDRFDGWAAWSGTSFAAPRVVAALARLLQGGTAPDDAVYQLIGDESLDRKPMLGTVVPGAP